MSLTCGVIITTHNRQTDLERTCRVLAELNPLPDEVLICADGCSDGTVDFLKKSHPEFKLLINPTSRGSIASRDAMMRAAESDVLFSLDDDSHPVGLDAIARIKAVFSANSRLAVASFPQRSDEVPESLTAEDFGAPHFAGTYSDCACALRRQTYLDLGGHFLPFHHSYEEPDFAMRCVCHGWQVRFEPQVVIRHHYSSTNRNEMSVHHLHACNELWSVLLRCPMPQVFSVALFRLIRQFGYAHQRGFDWVMREPFWWRRCALGLRTCLTQRSPLPWPRYRAWMGLVKKPIFSHGEWEGKFGREVT